MGCHGSIFKAILKWWRASSRSSSRVAKLLWAKTYSGHSLLSKSIMITGSHLMRCMITCWFDFYDLLPLSICTLIFEISSLKTWLWWTCFLVPVRTWFYCLCSRKNRVLTRQKIKFVKLNISKIKCKSIRGLAHCEF